MSVFVVRTDLALEEGERIRESGVEIHGVILEEETRPETGILVTRVKIETKNGAKIMGKPIGTYVTLEAGQLGNDEEEYQQEVAKELSMQLQKLIPDLETEKSVLVVGLGNRQVTADALGPRVADRLFINRHIILEFGAAAYNRKKMNRVSCLVPGVMAQTGMESAEIVRGVVKEKKIKIAVFSNKPHANTVDVVETLFGKGFFDAVQGQKTNVPKKPAPDGVYAIMERLDVSPEETIYVGDSWVDIETGRAAGNFAVGVLWGFRDEEELRAHHADAVITAPGELLELL